MVRNFLRRRGGFLVLAASILVLLLATAGLADNTTMELFENGSTRETTKDDEGNIIKTVDTSKPSADGVQTVTISTYGPGGDETSWEEKKTEKGKLISSQGYENEEEGSSYFSYVYNGQGKIIYESHEWWENGVLVEGSRTSYIHFRPEYKIPDKIETEYYLPSSGTWGRIPEGWLIQKPVQPKKAEEEPYPVTQPPVPPYKQTKKYEAKPAKAMSQEQPKTPETPPVVPVVGDLEPQPTQPKKAEEQPQTPEKPGGAKVHPTSFYLEGYGGLGGLGPTHGLNLTSNEPNTENNQLFNAMTNFRSRGRLDLTATGGFTLGTWFCYDCWTEELPDWMPDWMVDLGFAINFMHHVLEYASRGGKYSENFLFPGPFLFNNMGDSTFRSNGSMNSLGFMFKGRHRWLPDDEVPFGRVEVWGGVGPSINFVNQKPTVKFDTIRLSDGMPNFDFLNSYQKFHSSSATVAGLQVGVGVRYNIFRWLSADGFVQYDHCTPSFDLTGPAGITGKVTIPVDHFSFNLGLAYQF